MPLDVTRVLVRRAGAPGRVPDAPAPAATGDRPATGRRDGGGGAPGLELRELDATALARLAAVGALGLETGLLDAARTGRVRCFAALDGGARVVAHDFLATGEVPARWNAGGRRFRGIGLDLAPGLAYLFKAWTAPALRGRGVHGALLGHALGALDAEGVEAVVTTADWTNDASLAGFARAGFERRGLAAELVLGGHRWRVPAPFEAVPGRRVRMTGGSP